MLGAMTLRQAGKGGNPGQPSQGLTLIELMLTLTITAVLLAVAIPQMRELIARKRLTGVANEMVTDMRFARTMVIDRSQPILVRFGSTANQWCYTVFSEGVGAGNLCDCTATPICPNVSNPPIALKSVYVRQDSGITLSSVPAVLLFTQFAGPADPAVLNVQLQSSLGGTVRVGLASAGRATVCTVSGQLNDFKACP